jgi:hypothetical protein
LVIVEMSGKKNVSYRPPSNEETKKWEERAEKIRKNQTAHPPGVSSTRGGKRRTMKRRSMRRKTHKRRRC